MRHADAALKMPFDESAHATTYMARDITQNSHMHSRHGIVRHTAADSWYAVTYYISLYATPAFFILFSSAL